MTRSPALQTSLLDTPLDTAESMALRPLTAARRTNLGHGAWIDVRPGWLSGADDLFALLAAEVPWRGERRRMYDRTVDVPRLLAWYDETDAHHTRY
jgi:alkylated DNA repair dioxygenase AlkB